MNIEGLLITPTKIISTIGGDVFHAMKKSDLGYAGFGEAYFSTIEPNAIKAWKRHSTQTQNLAVPVGRIRLVVYDDRKVSATQGQVQVKELGRPDAYFRIQIPPELWYGFSCISVTPALLANCADLPHDPKESELRPFNDPDIPYQW